MEKTEDADKEKKTEVNNGAGKPYYTQRNNKEKPGSACNVTSVIIALSAADWPVESFSPCGEQPEDLLMRFIYSDQAVLNRWKQLDPKGQIPPNQWHAVLAYGTVRWLKTLGYDSAPAAFREAVSREEIRALINDGGAAVISGVFPQEGKPPLNHIVAITGYGTDKNGFYFIIDDPWGDYHTGYKNQKGKAVKMPIEDFNKMMKPLPQEKKWAHIIGRFGK